MAAPGRSGPSRLTLAILVLVTITVITLDLQDFGPLRSMQTTLRDAIAPAQDTGDSVFSPVTDTWRAITEFDDVEAENEVLRQELDELRSSAIRGQAARETLDELLAELDIEILSNVDTAVARVSDPAGNFDDFTIDINKGSNDGVVDGMPVVTQAGLVGKVISVEKDRSQVELMNESGFRLGVRIVGTGDIALARGVERGEDLRVDQGVDEGSEIEPGMLVVTSGIEGSAFPADIPVGVVSEVTIDEAELQQELRIRPVADIDSLTFVTVILWSVDSGSITDDPATDDGNDGGGGQ